MSNESMRQLGFYEFFAGGGMVRLGLGDNWTCLFANDFDAKKVLSYRRNFGGADELVHDDVRNVTTAQLPDNALLAWASFPCQDLSLAGAGAGLAGSRSGVFWPFWNLMSSLKNEGRNPPIIALENVAGLITSHNGLDLTNLITAMVENGYRVGALLIDGVHFVAQSRPRLFIIAVSSDVSIPADLLSELPNPMWHPQSLQNVVYDLPPDIRDAWQWWKLPFPLQKPPHLSNIVEDEPRGVEWHSPSETSNLLNMMAPPNLARVREAQRCGMRRIGTIYRRTRNGVQRAEVRFDGISGCLRTPAGGSSRQIIMIVDGDRIRSRLISPRETARLMGIPDSYELPERYNDTYHLTGDGVVVPAVAWLERHIFRPIATSLEKSTQVQRDKEPEFV